MNWNEIDGLSHTLNYAGNREKGVLLPDVGKTIALYIDDPIENEDRYCVYTVKEANGEVYMVEKGFTHEKRIFKNGMMWTYLDLPKTKRSRLAIAYHYGNENNLIICCIADSKALEDMIVSIVLKGATYVKPFWYKDINPYECDIQYVTDHAIMSNDVE